MKSRMDMLDELEAAKNKVDFGWREEIAQKIFIGWVVSGAARGSQIGNLSSDELACHALDHAQAFITACTRRRKK